MFGPWGSFSSSRLSNCSVKQVDGVSKASAEQRSPLLNQGEENITWQGTLPAIPHYRGSHTGKETTTSMSRILVVDQERRPLMPTTPARARILLKQGKVAILRRFPLVLILKEARPEAVVEPLRVK